MLVVVDSNVVIASLISEGITSTILFSDKIDFISPSFMMKEIREHLDELASRTGIPEDELEISLEILESRIKTFSCPLYGDFIEKAMKVSVDPDDIDFFALALKFDCPIWSHDKHFLMQSDVKVFKTKDLVELLL